MLYDASSKTLKNNMAESKKKNDQILSYLKEEGNINRQTQPKSTKILGR